MGAKKTVVMAVGARPNFMKLAPLWKRLSAHRALHPLIVHTGQHYDQNMSGAFFEELELPAPHISLGVGSGSHGWQTARVLEGFENTLLDLAPDLVIVFGDVNSTLACSLAAAKLNMPLAHVEAGLRSRNRRMPEEINRILTDHLADYLFAPSEDSVSNLLHEGIPRSSIFLVGNIMIDTLYQGLERAMDSGVLARLGVAEKQYLLVTLHRAENVDDAARVAIVLHIVKQLQEQYRIVFPMHPRTRKRLDALNLLDRLESMDNIRLCRPLGYIDFIRLEHDALAVLTDSGGVQEETTVMGVPCVTLRDETERPVTVSMGTNRVTGLDATAVLEAIDDIMAGRWAKGCQPDLWDGRTALRIEAILLEELLSA